MVLFNLPDRGSAGSLNCMRRASLAAMMGHLTGNLRANCGPGGAAPTPFAAPAVQAPAAAVQTLMAAGVRPGANLLAALEPFSEGPGPGSGLGFRRSSAQRLDESSSVPQLVGLPPMLAPQPDAQLLVANPNPSSEFHRGVAPGEARHGNSAENGPGAVARPGTCGGRDVLAREAEAAYVQRMLLAQQYAQVKTFDLDFAWVVADYLLFNRPSGCLLLSVWFPVQAQMISPALLPHALLPAPLPPCLEVAQPAPSVPAGVLPFRD